MLPCEGPVCHCVSKWAHACRAPITVPLRNGCLQPVLLNPSCTLRTMARPPSLVTSFEYPPRKSTFIVVTINQISNPIHRSLISACTFFYLVAGDLHLILSLNPAPHSATASCPRFAPCRLPFIIMKMPFLPTPGECPRKPRHVFRELRKCCCRFGPVLQQRLGPPRKAE